MAATLTILVSTACYMAQKNRQDFENTVVAQTQQHLQTIAEAQSEYLYEVLNEIKKRPGSAAIQRCSRAY